MLTFNSYNNSKIFLSGFRNIGCMLFLCMMNISAMAQPMVLEYTILKGSQVVGNLHFSKSGDGHNAHFKVTSKVHTKLVIPIDVETAEQAFYKNGILQLSSIYRKVNRQERVNKSLRIDKSGYIITQHNQQKKLSIGPIRKSIPGIFCQEPLSINSIYSDNYEQLVPIRKIGEHRYKLTLPDGNYNYYQYKNGICTQVVLKHSLYTLQFILKK